MDPAKSGPNIFEAQILLAPKAPKQNVGCQPRTLEGEGGSRGGGGVTPLLLRCTALLIHHWGRISGTAVAHTSPLSYRRRQIGWGTVGITTEVERLSTERAHTHTGHPPPALWDTDACAHDRYRQAQGSIARHRVQEKRTSVTCRGRLSLQSTGKRKRCVLVRHI